MTTLADQPDVRSQTFRDRSPLEFHLLDLGEQPVLSSLAKGGQELKLSIGNVSAGAVTLEALKSSEPGGKVCHFTLRFRKGTLKEGALDNIVLEGPDSQWMLHSAPNSLTRADELYITGPTNHAIDPSQTRLLTLKNVQANGERGTRNTRVEFLYQGLEHKARSLSGHREQTLTVANQYPPEAGGAPIQAGPPLHLGFVGPNTVLNDAQKEVPHGSSLTIELTNISSGADDKPLVFQKDSSNQDASSKLILAFDVNDNNQKDWALGTKSEVTAIKVDCPEGWKPTRPVADVPEWEFLPKTDSFNLPSGQALTFTIKDIHTSLPAGPTNLYLKYENIGYPDGQFVLTVMKSPLIYSNHNVGIGTSAPTTKLDVKGDTHFSGNVNIDRTSSDGNSGVINQGTNRLLHTFGTQNFFAGENAGNFTMEGDDNTAMGYEALFGNTTGLRNTASGYGALYPNTTGKDNTAYGSTALFKNETGDNNTAIGSAALEYNATGNNNIALGYDAGQKLKRGDNNICIGNTGAAGDTGMIRIGTADNHKTTLLVGNVGIGTTAPETKLHVAGSLLVDGFKPTPPTPPTGIFFRSKFVTEKSYNLSILPHDHSGEGFNDGISINGFDGVSFCTGSNTRQERMRIYQDGKVCIGTVDPKSKLKGTLHIAGNAVTNNNAYRALTLAHEHAGTGTESHVSLYCERMVLCEAVCVTSDERIKLIRGVSNGASDLSALREIQITDFTMKDTISKGTATCKKVIGQQVEKVFPQAVSKHTDVVPDIYQRASIEDGWVNLATDLKIGDRVKLITEEGEGIHEVLEVQEGRFQTEFKPEGEDVFVYGREVNDFRTVDYEAISMLNVSATQQIKKEKDAEVKALQDENAALREEMGALRARLHRLEELADRLVSAEQDNASEVTGTKRIAAKAI